MSDQTIGGDLTILMAVLNWAARWRDEHGRPLLDRNPLKGLRKPVEKNPVRVVVTGQGKPGASEGVLPGRLAVSRRPRARA